MRRIIAPAALLIVAALSLTGCAGAVDESVSMPGGVSAPMPDVNFESSDGGGVVAESPDRQVITTGYMTVTAEDPLAASTEAAKIIEGAGGRVESRTEYAPTNGDKGSAIITLRVPADSLTAVVEKLKKLGTLQELSTNESDVTMQTQDLDARIAALQASVDRLLALLTKATDTTTLIELETALSSRQAELDSLTSQRRYLADQVAMSTLTLNLISVADTPATTPDTFWSGLVAGWNAFIAFFAGLIVVIGVLLPWLAFAALVTILIIVLVRRRARRRAAHTPTVEAPAAQPAEAVAPVAEAAPAAAKKPAAKKPSSTVNK